MALYNLAVLGVKVIFGLIMVAFLGIIAAWLRSNKPFKHIWAEVVYELFYNILGVKALLEDVIMKEKIENIELPSASGKVALITGGARGIGVEIVKRLMKHDARVIIGCRNIMAGQKLFKTIREEGIETGECEVFELDLNSLESVKMFAAAVKQKYPKIHILINNAGKMFGPYMETEDGYESQFGINYLSHFLLTHLLLSEVIAAGEPKDNARIVNVTSCAHTVGEINFEDINSRKLYIPSAAYAQSKLAQILFTNYLHMLMKEQNLFVNVYSVHPGIVDTDLFNDTYIKKLIGSWLISKLFKTPAQGAASILHAALSHKMETAGGTYVSNCEIMPTCQLAYSTIFQETMFEFSKNLLNIDVFGKA